MIRTAEDQSPERGDRSRVIAVINGKGGVMKTSVAVNVAGRLAAGGYRVLLIDLDPQATGIRMDLGLTGHEQDDKGKALLEAIWSDEPMPIVKGVRTNLDVIFGGPNLEVLGVLSRTPSLVESLTTGAVPTEFARKVDEIAGEYDLIFMDSPPGNADVQDMALAAAGWILVPVRTDPASWGGGMVGIGPRVKAARKTNPDLRYLGAVIAGHNSGATRVERQTREAFVASIGQTVPLFSTFIRHSETSANECRLRGQLAHELARDAAEGRAEVFKELRARKARVAGDGESLPLSTQLSGTAGDLAEDYRLLAQEICARIAEAVTGHPVDPRGADAAAAAGTAAVSGSEHHSQGDGGAVYSVDLTQTRESGAIR